MIATFDINSGFKQHIRWDDALTHRTYNTTTERVSGIVIKRNDKTTWVSVPPLGLSVIKRHNVKHNVSAEATP